jgi:ubiquinone/menaquinone biosynthesis C-methylase UbiE
LNSDPRYGGLRMISKHGAPSGHDERIGAVAHHLGAEGYERSRIQPYIARVHDAMLDSLVDRLDSPREILDVGCGTGRLLRRLAERWPEAELIGADPSEDMVSVARRESSGVAFHVAGAESLPIETASIDLAVSSISLHHWDDPTQGLKEIARVLRPGGCLCLADIVLPRWLARLLHSGARNPAAIHALVSQSGLALELQRVTLARVIVVVVARKPATASGE